MTIKFVDLFCGVGGMRLGLERALDSFGKDYKCELSSDIDLKARETYLLNFGVEPEGDICKIESAPVHDVLLAGFPCQPFSYAGVRRGFGDTRGTLFFEVERIVQASKPSIILLENVRGLVTHDNGKTLKTIMSRLEQIGYGVTFRVLNSADHGVPQNRMRIYIVAILGGTPKLSLSNQDRFIDTQSRARQQPNFFEVDQTVSVSSILEESVNAKYECSPKFTKGLRQAIGEDLSKLAGYRMIDSRNGNSIHSWDIGLKGRCTNTEKDLLNSIVANRRRHEFGIHQDGKALTKKQIRTFFDNPNLDALIDSLLSKGYLRDDGKKYNLTAGNMSFEIYKFLDPESVSVTVVSSDAHKIGVVQNGVPRRLTPREVARLQGFPNEFKLHPNDLASYRQMGNSVTVPVIQKVLSSVILENQSILPRKFRIDN